MSEIQFDEKLLNEIVKNVPFSEKQTKGFFEIAGIGSREVSFSNCYAYYLNPNEEHGLGRLFIDTLLLLLGDPFSLDHFVVEIEVPTEHQKFIDILVRGVGIDLGKFLILENKIFHEINNPFSEYWNYCNGSEKDKRLVILTLKNENYSITRKMIEFKEIIEWSNQLHIDWVNEINRVKIETELICATDEQEIFYKNFFKSISTLNMYTKMTKPVEFYFDHIEESNEIERCKAETKKYVIQQVETAAGNLKLKLGRKESERLRDLIIEGKEELGFYSIIFDGIFERGCNLRIVFGLGKESTKRAAELDKIFSEKVEKFELQSKDKFTTGHGWHNYLTRRYSLTKNQFSTLNEFISDSIKTDFSALANEILEYLENKKI